ncbi:MAG: polysaccharide deacetylase family protein [Chryseolinea sp.]
MIRDTRYFTGYLFYAVVVFGLSGCSEKQEPHPGICLSFDDRSVREWYSLKNLLDSANAKVTFFVTQFDSLDSVEISLLKDLEADGHEIGSHGALHVISERYIKEHTYKTYLQNEVEAETSAMKKHGFKPSSFAYPYGAKYWFTDYLLLKKFKVVRAVERLNDSGDISLIDDIYYDFDGDRTISAVGIDHASGLKNDMITKAMSRAREKNEVLILYGHVPASAGDSSDYSFDVSLLRFILKEASRNNLRHYKTSEL